MVNSKNQRDRKVLGILLIEGLANALILVVKLVVGASTGSLAVLGDAILSSPAWSSRSGTMSRGARSMTCSCRLSVSVNQRVVRRWTRSRRAPGC